MTLIFEFKGGIIRFTGKYYKSEKDRGDEKVSKSIINVHVHQWLYDKMNEIKSKSEYTQAEAFDVLFRTMDIEVQTIQAAYDSLKKEFENYKVEFEKVYNEKMELAKTVETLQKQLKRYEEQEKEHQKIVQESKKLLKK